MAGFLKSLSLIDAEEIKITKSWIETPMDYGKIKKDSGKITAIFSDNDPVVDLREKELFEKYLNSKILIEYDKGHFSDDTGIKELPSAFSAILELSVKNI